MNKTNGIIFLACFAVFVTIIGIVNRKENDNRYLNMEFNGIVEFVTYDIKEMPTVTIKDHDYFIGAFYNFNKNIEVGDSLIKKRGQYYFKLIKKSSGESKIYDQ